MQTGVSADVLDIEAHGLPLIADLPIPRCPTAITGRGGRHYYFRAGTLAGCGPLYVGDTKIGDVKAARGYVLVPPSRSEYGPYTWAPGLALGEVELPDGPGWIADLREARRRGVPGGVTRRSLTRDAVTPLGTSANGVIDRSADDMTRAISVLADGGTDADVIAALMAGGAYQDREARGTGDDYLARTIDAAHAYVQAAFVLCEVRRTSRDSRQLTIGFTVLDGPHAGLFLNAGTFDFPVTDRSRERWRALCCAADIDEHERCPEVRLRKRELRVELIGDAPVRCGRFLPPE